MVSIVASGRLRGPLVSVGLPTFNRRQQVARAAAAVLQQDYQPLELVIADNGSTDGTAEYLSDLAEAHQEVALILASENAGATANFERVRRRSNGSYFMWLGDDDWIDGGYLEKCAEVLSSDDSVAMACGRVRYHSDSGDWLEYPVVNTYSEIPSERVLEYFRHVGANGTFYGLTRVDLLRRIPPISNLMGGDWLHVAAVAFLGHIRIVETTEIHRPVGGATRSLADVAEHLGLNAFQRLAPQIAIAWFVLADIGWRSPVYRPLGRVGRLALAVRAFGIVWRRFVPRAVCKFMRLRMSNAAARIAELKFIRS